MLCRWQYAFFVATLTSAAIAQQDGSPSIDELRAPASPAFNLLGISPATVERPNTPRAFATSIFSGVERSNGGFPKDFAMEFAPYWWSSHPHLSFDDYYKANVGQTIMQTLSFSLATTDIPDPAGGAMPSPGTRVGAGMRFHLFSGDPAPGLAQSVSKLKQAQLDLLAFVPDSGPVDENDPEYKKALADVAKNGKAVQDFDKQRVGWVCEVAAAVADDFADDHSSNGKLTRAGVWITPAYTSPPDSALSSLTFVGIGRYIYDDVNRTQNMYDVGARIIWKSSDLPLAVSAEHVQRFVEGGSDTQRTAGILEYKVNDTYSLVASFGKNFSTDFEGKADVFAEFGVNFGFGKGPVVN